MDFYYTIASPPCRSVLMVAKALNIELNKKVLNVRSGEHMTPEFLKINPQHKVPTLVGLWESRAILIYLVEKFAQDDTLYPKCPEKRAKVNQRLFFDMNLYECFRAFWFPQLFQKAPADPELLKKLHEQYAFLDTFLNGQSYVTGDNLTIADISLLASISTMDVAGMELGKHANLLRWYEQCKKVVPGADENWEGCLAWAISRRLSN